METCLESVSELNIPNGMDIKKELTIFYQKLSKFQTHCGKNEHQIEIEKLILNAKIFELHEVQG